MDAPPAAETPRQQQEEVGPEIPAYLRDTYYWAYLNPKIVPLLENELVVSAILWGQHHRLQHAAFSQIPPGSRVLQPAAVYGGFSANLARHLGPDGSLTVTDIAPIQVANTATKLAGATNATARLGDARAPTGGPYDIVCSYFLMHEVPDDAKRQIMDALLGQIEPGGKVVFIDYHKPGWANPLKLITSVVFDTLEPFAKSLWRHELRDFATRPEQFSWRKSTFLGGLYQLVTAEHKTG
ncbi:MAG: class I SAM-dependent methyltransferase [Alphaproteobacteria bacterium]|nr:class I SAM-dependent methyltransferase [Alphaproteobacteria bacterium]